MRNRRIWDLRRGDYDDNRLSPYGGGLRTVIFSSLLEFNYLKAPLGLIFLLVIPAAILGAVPSIVITYSVLIRQTATYARSSMIIGVGLIVVLLAIAIIIGRPLLAFAVENLQHLRYILVFPIFVVLREAIRVAAEQIVGSSITPTQLSRIRFVGTLIAAMVFAGLGIALVASIELSVGLKLVNVEQVRPWTTLGAALSNAVLILGLSTVFESLYWFWREIRLNKPVDNWIPNPSPGPTSLRVAHLSDLHLVGERYGYRMETGVYGPRGNHSIRNAMRKLAAIQTETKLDRVLITGDVTDAGTRAEWTAFMDLLRRCPIVQSRVSFVPGNHDVNIVDRTNPGRLDLPGSTGLSLRKLRVVLALDSLQGDRAHLVDRKSGGLGPLLKDFLREDDRLERLRSLAERGTIRGRWEMTKVWNAIFPLVEPPSDQSSYGLILLDSNAPSHIALTNAIGVVHPTQLKALRLILRNSPGSAWIILLHHQLVEYPITRIPLRDRIGLALVNAPDVLATIAPHASRLLVMHGHRHIDWIGTYGDLILCSAPSVSLGTEGKREPGSFHVYELSVASGGNIRLSASEQRYVA